MKRNIGLLRIFQQVLPFTICKAFVRLHQDYGDVLFNEALNNSFHQRSIRYNAVIAITVAIRGISKKKLYQKLGFELL